MQAGEIVLEPLADGLTAKVSLRPHRSVDLGAGRGKPLEAEVHGGVVGVIFDGRGRPIVVPETERSKTVTRWAQALGAYPA